MTNFFFNWCFVWYLIIVCCIDAVSAEEDNLLVVMSDILKPSFMTKTVGHFHNLSLGSPKRNHDGMFIRNGSQPFYMSIGGRHAEFVDVFDLKSRSSKLFLRGNPLLHFNHFNLVALKSSNNSNQLDFYVPCGFVGHSVNAEESLDAMRILSWHPDRARKSEMFSVRIGPELSPPIGGCSAIGVSHKVGNFADMVCMVGGSTGTHDKGIFRNHSRCYNARTSSWFELPDFPFGIDHGNAGIIESGACNAGDSERLVVLGYRTSAYGNCPGHVYALDLIRDENGVLIGSGSNWKLLNADISSISMSVRKSAAGIIVADKGRFIFQFGGIIHGQNRADQKKWMSEINAF
jgi:hypothetical protein